MSIKGENYRQHHYRHLSSSSWAKKDKDNTFKINICQELITTEILFLRITKRIFYR